MLDAMRRFAQNGVIVFGVQNDFTATSVNELNGLPIAYPELQGSWIAVTSAVPTLRDGRIVQAFRQSAACNEAAAFCIAANGAVWAATANTGGYGAVAGTSFAVPQVAGAIAILAEAFPQLSPPQLRDRLLRIPGVGGVNVFGGGLPLYDETGRLWGAIGVSGDSSCVDHIIAWKVRHLLKLDYVPAGVSPTKDDNIVHDLTDGKSKKGWGHPKCSNEAARIAQELPKSHPVRRPSQK